MEASRILGGYVVGFRENVKLTYIIKRHMISIILGALRLHSNKFLELVDKAKYHTCNILSKLNVLDRKYARKLRVEGIGTIRSPQSDRQRSFLHLIF
jgi:hypothetical protein